MHFAGRVKEGGLGKLAYTRTMADIDNIKTLAAIKRAHLGSH